MPKFMFFGAAFFLIALAPASLTLARDGSSGSERGYQRVRGDHHGGGLHRAGPTIVIDGGGDSPSSYNACAQYPGYDPASATYLGPDGSRYPCQ